MNKLDTSLVGKTYFGEAGYRELLSNIIEHGILQDDRTGVGRKKLISQKLVFDMQDGFPVHSSRSCPFSFAFKEYQFFLSGKCNIHDTLSAEGINFWKGNTSREFLDKSNLQYLNEGNYGMAYGAQLRNFNGGFDVKTQQVIPNSGIDQMRIAFETLKNDPFSSRHYVTMWNPSQLKKMALPPCWHSHQWVVIEHNGGKFLNLEVTARASDLLFGCPFNYSEYAYLLCAYSKALKMTPAALICELTDVHLYQNQIDYAKELLTRNFSTEKCELEFTKELNNFDDIVNLTINDLNLILPDGYINKSPFVTSIPKMAV